MDMPESGVEHRSPPLPPLASIGKIFTSTSAVFQKST
jgi:hypothetical protein